MKHEVMGANAEKQEIPAEFRVRIDNGKSVVNLMEELKMGGTVQFVATKNFDLWLSDMGHAKILSRNGIQDEDVKTTGAAWMQEEFLEVEYRGPATDSERAAIRKELEVLM